MSLHLILGPMSSGKTNRLLVTAEIIENNGKNVVVWSFGDRKQGLITAKTGKARVADPLFSFSHDTDVVYVDEVQFCTDVDRLVVLSKHVDNVICFGLLSDFRATMFDAVAKLVPYSETVEILPPLEPCYNCKTKPPYAAVNARYKTNESGAERLVFEGPQKLLDTSNVYRYHVICHKCHVRS